VCRPRFRLSSRFHPRSLRQSNIKKPQPAPCLAASVHVSSSRSPSPVDAADADAASLLDGSCAHGPLHSLPLPLHRRRRRPALPRVARRTRTERRRRTMIRRPCLMEPAGMDRFIHRFFLSTGRSGGQPCLGLRAAPDGEAATATALGPAASTRQERR
jgi:hypothetical protein